MRGAVFLTPPACLALLHEQATLKLLVNGPIPVSPDGEPLLGLAPEYSNAFVAAGFTGTAPAVHCSLLASCRMLSLWLRSNKLWIPAPAFICGLHPLCTRMSLDSSIGAGLCSLCLSSCSGHRRCGRRGPLDGRVDRRGPAQPRPLAARHPTVSHDLCSRHLVWTAPCASARRLVRSVPGLPLSARGVSALDQCRRTSATRQLISTL